MITPGKVIQNLAPLVFLTLFMSGLVFFGFTTARMAVAVIVIVFISSAVMMIVYRFLFEKEP